MPYFLVGTFHCYEGVSYAHLQHKHIIMSKKTDIQIQSSWMNEWYVRRHKRNHVFYNYTSFFMLHLLLKLKMKQQVADMAVSTTKITDYNTGITWLIILGRGSKLYHVC